MSGTMPSVLAFEALNGFFLPLSERFKELKQPILFLLCLYVQEPLFKLLRAEPSREGKVTHL